jgi:hypothetical protein
MAGRRGRIGLARLRRAGGDAVKRVWTPSIAYSSMTFQKAVAAGIGSPRRGFQWNSQLKQHVRSDFLAAGSPATSKPTGDAVRKDDVIT